MDWSEKLFLTLCFGPIVITLIKLIAIIVGAAVILVVSYLLLKEEKRKHDVFNKTNSTQTKYCKR